MLDYDGSPVERHGGLASNSRRPHTVGRPAVRGLTTRCGLAGGSEWKYRSDFLGFERGRLGSGIFHRVLVTELCGNSLLPCYAKAIALSHS